MFKANIHKANEDSYIDCLLPRGRPMTWVYYLKVSFMMYTISNRERSNRPSKIVNGVYFYQNLSFIHLNQQKGCITILFSCFYTPKGEIADHTADQTTQMV